MEVGAYLLTYPIVDWRQQINYPLAFRSFCLYFYFNLLLIILRKSSIFHVTTKTTFLVIHPFEDCVN